MRVVQTRNICANLRGHKIVLSCYHVLHMLKTVPLRDVEVMNGAFDAIPVLNHLFEVLISLSYTMLMLA